MRDFRSLKVWEKSHQLTLAVYKATAGFHKDGIESIFMRMDGSDKWANVTEDDLHPHLKARMSQRGVTRREIEQALNEGWKASDTKLGTLGKTIVCHYHAEWEGKFYEEKEITVYYKVIDGHPMLLTVKARYGKNFPRGDLL